MNSLEETALEVAQKMDDVFLRNVPADVLRSYARRLVAALGAQEPVSEVWKPGNPLQVEQGLSNTLTVMLPMGMKLFAALVLPSVPEVTDAMITAYLKANDAYWHETDALEPPPDKWRIGTPRDATRVSLEAAFRAAAIRALK